MRQLLLALLLLCAASLPAHAYKNPGPYGVNIRWDACFADGGTLNKSFTCDTNTGSEKLVLSVVLPFDTQNISGWEAVVDLASAGATLPPWWGFRNVGTCRQASLAANFTPTGAVNCLDWSAGQASGGLGAYSIGSRGANTARILMAIAVPPDALASLVGLDEYFIANLSINHAKTVGTGSCAGCTTPVCVVFNRAKFTTPIAANDRVLSTPTNFTDSNYATWQGGAGVVVGTAVGCPAATPTRQQTWGAVKSLYR